jgi:CBS domain containing-hemolysin-like protein
MEIAYVSSNRLRIELDKKQGHFGSGIVTMLVNHPSKFLATMLLGNNIALVIYGIKMAYILEPSLHIYFKSPVLLLTFQTILSTLLILLTAEFLPKIVFRSIPNYALNIFAAPVAFFYFLFYPITFAIARLSVFIINRFHRNDDDQELRTNKVFGKIDLLYLINESQDSKTEESSQDNDLKLFQNALEFSSVKVRDCMVPRTEIAALEIGSSIDEFRQNFIETGFSKILIYKDNIDNMIGYITSKSMFKNIRSIRDQVIEISFVPETMAANILLEKFIQEKKSMAVVVDEFGGLSGMLTIEDIIEEIFGEIEDEHDTIELIDKQINEQEYIFSGRLEIDFINEKYKLKIPESEDYETLAGFIFHHHENIPKLNERIDIDRFEIKILKVTSTKIDLVHLKLILS